MRKLLTLLFLLGLLAGAPAPQAFAQATPAPAWAKVTDPAPATAPLNAIASDPVNGSLWLSISGVGMDVSTDRGQTWTLQNAGLSLFKVNQIGFNAIGDPIAVDGFNPPIGVFRFTNGTWTAATGLTATATFAQPILDSTGALIEVSGYGADVFRSTDNGNSFTKAAPAITGGTGALWCSVVGPDGTLYAGGEAPAGAYASKDNGATWTAIGPAAPAYTGNISAMVINSAGTLLVARANAASGLEIQALVNGSWVSSGAGIPAWNPINSLCKDTAGNLYAVVTSKATPATSTIYRSGDGGSNWALFNSGLTGSVVSLTADRSGNLSAATSAGIYTINTGSTANTTGGTTGGTTNTTGSGAANGGTTGTATTGAGGGSTSATTSTTGSANGSTTGGTIPPQSVLSLGVQPASECQVDLTWAPQASPLTIQRSGGPSGATWVNVRATPAYEGIWNDTSVWPATTYQYRLTDGVNFSPVVSVSTLAVPAGANATPTNVAVTSTTPTTATISFTDTNSTVSSHEYWIERSDDDGATYHAVGTCGQGSAGPYTDTQLAPATIYLYRVRCLSGGLSASAYCSPVSVTTLALPAGTPNNPGKVGTTDLSATSIQLNWPDTNNGEASYEIWRSGWAFSPSQFKFTKVGTTSGGATSFIDTGLTPETPYAYKVRAVSTTTVDSEYTDPIFETTASAGTGSPKTYDIGPGQPYATIGQFPWRSLGPGDDVRIHGNGAAAYHELLLLSNRGTAAAPITIEGIPDAQGNPPILDGANATQNSQFAYNYAVYGSIGLITTYRTPTSLAAYKPGYLVVKNLELRNCYWGDSAPGTSAPTTPLTFTDYTGKVQPYHQVGAGVYMLTGDNFTIEGCNIHGNGEGVFGAGQSSYDRLMENIVLRDNDIWGNGTTGPNSFSQHGSYLEGLHTLYEGNHYGPDRAGSAGGSLKDRSIAPVIRYNWIEASARIIDLVETENEEDLALADPSYASAYVYGNILEDDDARCQKIVHYGGDSLPPAYYRTGPLYFYNNTVISTIPQSAQFDILTFDLTNAGETVDARNNIFVSEVPGSTSPPELDLLPVFGVGSFGVNWASNGWKPTFSGKPFAGVDAGIVNILSGAADPGFNAYPTDLSLSATSPAIGKSGPLSGALSAYPLTGEYSTQTVIPRANANDLGALASGTIAPPVDPLQAEVDALTAQVVSLQTQLTAAQADDTDQKANVASITTQLATAQASLAVAQASLATANQNLATANANILSLQGLLQTAQQSATQWQAADTSDKSSLVIANQTAASLQAKITAAQASLAMAQNALAGN